MDEKVIHNSKVLQNDPIVTVPKYPTTLMIGRSKTAQKTSRWYLNGEKAGTHPLTPNGETKH